MKRFLMLLLFAVPVAVAAPVVPDTVAERARACLSCHAAEGRRVKDEYYPRLAGKPAGYLLNQMLHFRDGRRQNRAMALLMENLSDGFLAELAVYFSTVPATYSLAGAATVRGETKPVPALVSQGDPARKIPACTDCHGKELLGVAPALPGLLGLPSDYLSAQFGAWKVGTRRAAAPDCMADIARQLTETEVNAIANWLASRPLPADARPAAASAAELPMRCGSMTAPAVRP